MRDHTPGKHLAVPIRFADGEICEVICRRPTTEEVIVYNRELYDFSQVDASGQGLGMNYQAAVSAALKVIVGWTPADTFGVAGAAYSADPQSPQFREDWRDLLRTSEPQMLVQVASKVFGGVLSGKPHPF